MTAAPTEPEYVRFALTRYVVAATLARCADGGGIVAVVLIVTASGGPGWLAGLLGASITAPHVAGPFLARRLDIARDGRTVIAAACVIHGAALAAAVLLYPAVVVVVPAVLLVIVGLSGPFLTGGISSRLPAIVGPSRTTQRRAQGWDVATYGLGGTIGPSAVALVSAWSTPTAAALCLAAATLVAALVVRLLPKSSSNTIADVPRPVRTLQLMVRSGPLRRTLCLTMVVAFAVAVLPIVAVSSGAEVGQAGAAAGALTAAYGLGNLAGSAALMIRPLRGPADTAMVLLALMVTAGLIGVLLAPSFPVSVVAYGATGIANAYFFAATLAARSEHAPAAARGQVFVWVGALKITAGSAGTATAGAIVTTNTHLPLVLGVALVAVSAAIVWVDHRVHP